MTKVTKQLNSGTLVKTLDLAYEKALKGLPGLGSAVDLAKSYMNNRNDPIKNADRLIKYQSVKAGGVGFITNLGGLLTLPVTIPADLSSIIYIQLRMIAAIAYMGGHDLRDDRIKTLAFACLLGNSAFEVLKEAGVTVGKKVVTSLIQKVPGETIIAINKKIGFRLLTKFGEKGVINLGKIAPFVSGITGGGFDAIATRTIGKIAKKIFLES